MEFVCDVSCGGAESWMPTALADALCAYSSAHARRALLTWLNTVRATTEEYEECPSLTLPSAPAPSPTPEDPFDDILSRLGQEIYQLEEYQRKLNSPSCSELDGSIYELFDGCLDEMARADVADSSTATFETAAGSPTEDASDSGASMLSDDTPRPPSEQENCAVALNDASEVTVTEGSSDASVLLAPRRRHCNSASNEGLYDNIDRPSEKPQSSSRVESLKSRLDSDSDASSTQWSYRAFSTDDEAEAALYSPVWGCSTGYHKSDEILQTVLRQNHADVNSITFDTVSEFGADARSEYAPSLEGEEGCSGSVEGFGAERAQSPQYGAVCDARDDTRYASVMHQDENIYEEIDLGYTTQISVDRYSSHSVELESCDDSVSSPEGTLLSQPRCQSPEYVNLTDYGAYAITKDVIFWKDLLLLPDYNEDEEDEWITPEESCAYGQERRPPYIIPRITSYRYPPARLSVAPTALPNYSEEHLQGSPPTLVIKDNKRPFDTGHAPHGDWSPMSERSRLELERDFISSGDSPPARVNKRFGSNENILGSTARRPFHLAVPTDGSDLELRDSHDDTRKRKSRSMLAAGVRLGRSPVPAPRILPPSEIPFSGSVQEPLFQAKVKRTKVSEIGKKPRKNWTENHLVLTNTHLLFYKDEKTYHSAVLKASGAPPSPTGGSRSAELALPLQGASVSKCTQHHTSRFAKSIVVTVGSDQILIQDDSTAGAAYWYESISKAITRTPQEVHFMDLVATPPTARKSSNRKVGESSNEDLSDSVERAKVKKKLKKFLNRRPTKEHLIKKGWYKDEPVFGRSLEEVCGAGAGEGPRIPEFVERCVHEIESSAENMHTDGLYRASGNLSQVQKIRLQVDQNNFAIVENNNDVHVLTGSLKLFFRELKEPLIPWKLFNQTLAATVIKNRDARVKEFRDIVNSLPRCNYDTLKFLLEHLLRVTEHSAKNRMHISNLAIVFGPTLLWAPAECAHNIATDCIQQNHAIEILLTDFHEIFTKDTNKKS